MGTLQALIAFSLVLLQLSCALHFTLVPHTFSAALGGVVHVHGSSRARVAPRVARAPHSQALVADALSCAVDVCPFADAPHGSLPFLAQAASHAATFGATSLLSETEPRAETARRVFLSAPKTSPPI